MKRKLFLTDINKKIDYLTPTHYWCMQEILDNSWKSVGNIPHIALGWARCAVSLMFMGKNNGSVPELVRSVDVVKTGVMLGLSKEWDSSDSAYLFPHCLPNTSLLGERLHLQRQLLERSSVGKRNSLSSKSQIHLVVIGDRRLNVLLYLFPLPRRVQYFLRLPIAGILILPHQRM